MSDSLPPNWSAAVLEDVVTISKEKVDPRKFPNARYVGLEHIESGTNKLLGYGAANTTRSSKGVFHDSDVLYGKLRPYLRKLCIPGFDGVCSTDILVLRAKDQIDPQFILHALSLPDFTKYAIAESKGINLPRVSPGAVAQYSLPIAPANEQKRIVKKIEALREKSRRAKDALDAIPPLLERFRQSVLAAAFRGDLTADWRAKNPNTEPATELLARIRKERRTKWETTELAKYKNKKSPANGKQKYQEFQPLDISNLHELPESWCWMRLLEAGAMNRGKSKHRPRNDPSLFDGKYPFIQTGDVSNSLGKIINHRQTYNEKGLRQSELWPAGTVLITIAANIAESAILTYPACFPDSIVGILPDQRVCSSEYVEFFIRTARSDLNAFAPATAQKNINLAILSEVIIPLPPLNEQQILVDRLARSLNRIQQIETELNQLKIANEALALSILAKAFRGELVPQDPHDEPASVLLARLRSECQEKSNSKLTF